MSADVFSFIMRNPISFTRTKEPEKMHGNKLKNPYEWKNFNLKFQACLESHGLAVLHKILTGN